MLAGNFFFWKYQLGKPDAGWQKLNIDVSFIQEGQLSVTIHGVKLGLYVSTSSLP
jgi:hypothetical protein